mmetsp:Transcript_96874/g.235476  ORF Transcript_96874/g.235476 Transcript_96874/m.235476 type:complete len:296 (-) Transcript_96874:23-910(-)
MRAVHPEEPGAFWRQVLLWSGPACEQWPAHRGRMHRPPRPRERHPDARRCCRLPRGHGVRPPERHVHHALWRGGAHDPRHGHRDRHWLHGRPSDHDPADAWLQAPERQCVRAHGAPGRCHEAVRPAPALCGLPLRSRSGSLPAHEDGRPGLLHAGHDHRDHRPGVHLLPDAPKAAAEEARGAAAQGRAQRDGHGAAAGPRHPGDGRPESGLRGAGRPGRHHRGVPPGGAERGGDDLRAVQQARRRCSSSHPRTDVLRARRCMVPSLRISDERLHTGCCAEIGPLEGSYSRETGRF